MVSALPGNLSGHFASRQPKTCLSLSYLAVPEVRQQIPTAIPVLRSRDSVSNWEANFL